MNDQELLISRLEDLAEKSINNNIYTYSSFLNMMEIDVFVRNRLKFAYIDFSLFGGIDICERKIICFGSEKQCGYKEKYPLVCLKIQPIIQKFADSLTHRDYLGSLMNMGIDRSTIGDIFVNNNIGYVFCLQKIAPYIAENLATINHTKIICSITDEYSQIISAQAEKINLPVSSERLDGMISHIYNISRNDCNQLFRSKKIFINGRICENSSCLLKTDDMISVRGFGRFVYRGTDHVTRKGKLRVNIDKYI